MIRVDPSLDIRFDFEITRYKSSDLSGPILTNKSPLFQKPSEKSNKHDPEQDDQMSPRLREALSITSLTSSVASSISSASSTHGCRFSNSSIEEEQFARTFGPAILVDSSCTQPDRPARHTDPHKKLHKGVAEVNNNIGNSEEMQVRLDWCDGMVVGVQHMRF